MTARRPATPAPVFVVTGGGGFLGSHVLPQLRRAAPQARIIAMLRDGARVGLPDGVAVIAGDLRLQATWRQVPADVTHVIHLAAMIPWDKALAGAASMVADNLTPITHLIEVSAQWPHLRHVTYGSSVSVYRSSPGRLRETSPTVPPSLYGAAKLCGEQLLAVLALRGIAVASLRYSSLYGVGQYAGTVLPILVDRARRGMPIELFNASRVQDFVHVDDGARATVLASRREAAGPFNVGTGRSVTMTQLARAVVRVFDPDGRSTLVRVSSSGPDRGTRMDISRARRQLGYVPRVSLDAGLAAMSRVMEGRRRP